MDEEEVARELGGAGTIKADVGIAYDDSWLKGICI